MGTVNTRLVEQARSIFTKLGYTVSGRGTEFTAERGWKVVQVTATTEPEDAPESGGLRCFVTDEENEQAISRRLRRENPEYDWAIIAVTDEDYEVVRAPPGPDAAS